MEKLNHIFCSRKNVERYYHNEWCDKGDCHRLLPDSQMDELIMGIVDTETKGNKFAIGTKNHNDTFVLNFKDRSCLLLVRDCHPIDLRQFNFDNIKCIEINGNKFFKENNDD